MTDRPDLVLIVLEDSGQVLGCDGDPVAQQHNLTPNIDALAARGTRWANLFSTAPVCAPARSSLITGQHPIRLGTHQMRSRLVKTPTLFTQHLRQAGYFVSWPGKTDFNLHPDRAPDQPWRDDDQNWADRLRTGDLPDQPRLLYTNLGYTHESGMWPVYGPPERPEHSGWTGDGHADLPDPATMVVPPYLPDTPEVREDLARHYRNLKRADENVGEILAAVEASGRADRTIVMLIADHGRGMPREKRWCYPGGLRVPLILAGPGIEAGAVREDVVSMVDVPATLLDLAGVEPTGDGRSIFADTRPTLAFFGRDRMDEAYDCVRGCTDGRWFYLVNDFPDIARAQRNAYMEWLPTVGVMREKLAAGTLEHPQDVWFRPRPAEELYDLSVDPHAVKNLAAEPEHAVKLAELRAATEAWRIDCDDQGRGYEPAQIKAGLVEGDWLERYQKVAAPLPPDRQPPGRCGVLVRPGDG
jgi:arylsulfatase A-like enzyme